jgi:DNA polymerase-1
MSENPKKLFLLDAFALIYRAYFAFGQNQRYNSKGLNTSAILGFTNTLWGILKKQDPSHIAVVFDAPAATNRELEYSDYKANREAMPEDIRSALPYIKEVIEGFNIPMYLLEGYEADDIIGTFAKEAEKEGFTTYMMTPDKDYAQLVSENIFMYRPGRGGKPAEVWGIPEVCARFEIEDPLQVIDILGLWGDSVDNIPGIPGIGEKTSKKLVAQYGSVEGLIAHSHELKGKQKENVINFADQGLLSKKLATIILDVPVEYNFDDMKRVDANKDNLIKLFSELEFRTLGKQIFGEEIIAAPSGSQMDLFGGGSAEIEEPKEIKTIENTPHEYHLVDSADKRADLIAKLGKEKSFCFDTETTGLDAHQAELVGMSFAIKPHEAYYVPVPEDQDETKAIVAEFKALFENPDIEKVAQNIKYDLTILKWYGVELAGKYFDTMLAHYLLHPDMKHNMDLLAETYLYYQPVSIETLIGKKGKNQKSMRDVSPEEVTEYAAEDADITLQLKLYFEDKVNEDHLKELFNDIETPLISVLADMEREGIKLDVPAMEQFSIDLEADLKKLHTNIIELAGKEFNVDSPKQLGEILFEELQIVDKPKKTKTGQYATSEDVLSKLANAHDIVPNILDYRSLRKLKSTYVDSLPTMVNPKTGKIHTNYSQTIAATGRLSSNNPNLQNIPIRTERGRETRKAFIPRNDDYTLLSADYSQIELRIIAVVSEEENMQQAFIDGVDIHSATAAKVFGVGLEEVTREMRSKAKAVNFGITYGQTAFGLSQTLNIKRKEAKEIIDSYFEQYPGIRTYINGSIDFAKEHGYVETIMKRRRYLKDINSANSVVRGYAERNAINAPIQGSAADVIKVAMINLHEEIKKRKLKSKMLLQVHDELIFDVYKPELEEMKALVRDEMENAVSLKVPLTVEMEAAANWLEAH